MQRFSFGDALPGCMLTRVFGDPAIDAGARTPLMLQTVLGIDAARIASAFLVSPATMGQRLVRAKIKIRDLMRIFSGATVMMRKSAVAALKNLGYGKTAAYDALSPDGRFSAWLQFAPDGIITWKS